MRASFALRHPRAQRRLTTGIAGLLAWVLCLGFASPSWSTSLDEAETLFHTGKYDECIKAVAQEIDDGARGERWRVLKITAELTRGKYAEALESLKNAYRFYPTSVSLRFLGRDVYRFNGKDQDAANSLAMIERLVLASPERYSSPPDRVALGRFFLSRGADARKVLDQFYDVAIKQDPEFVEAHLATAELALTKQDFALAASTLRKAPKEAAVDPRYHFLLASAYADDDRAGSAKELDEALKINPRHVDSLLLRAEQHIDAERYGEAEKTLKQVFAVNPSEPRAWAFQAVVAHLRSDKKGEEAARLSALEPWGKNPEVDHLIGRKLSQKYRFAEGSALQRKALEVDPSYLPAKLQLCQDLLRLGDETEGWSLASEIFAKDGYNTLAYNLTTLHDRVSSFRTLQDSEFILRMDPREADLYGQRALDLLRRARKTLCEKYGVTLKEPVVVEIFPQKKESAVRTFGMPGAEGFLGVCFGRVITANSPASQGEHPSNWEAVLWHEFCHVVTLTKTRNKMPRWLSEGISVYEEENQDRSWATALNPRFREMLLDDDLTPLSKLSSAFMAPPSPLHLQFAYFESALAVSFLVEKAGLAALKSVLDDLGEGITINEALPRRTKMTLDQMDKEFGEFARQKARKVAPDLTWEEIDLPAEASSVEITTWLEKHPRSFPGQLRLATRLITEERWDKAREALETLRKLYPEYVGAENAYAMLAKVYRRTSDKAAEHAVLEDLAARNGSASEVYLRLMELDEAASDWKNLKKNAQRLLAVNPLIAAPHRSLARAAEQLGEREEAITAYRALALLSDTDPAEVHFRLAKLLLQSGKRTEARREVLKSLEDAPRFLEAHRLLLDLIEGDKPKSSR